MADGPTAGETVTKQRMLNSWLNQVKDNITTQINSGWHSGTRPAQATSQTFTSATPGKLTAGGTPTVDLGTNTLGTPSVDKITDSIITAAQLATVLVNYTSNLTKIRNVNLIQYENNTSEVSNQTVLAHLSSNTYEQTNTMSSLADANNVESGVDVDASEFVDFTTALYNSWNSLKTNTVTVQEYYCHSSCHTSCHGSRGRR